MSKLEVFPGSERLGSKEFEVRACPFEASMGDSPSGAASDR